MPVGDWIWPAVWLLPAESDYGPWPLSGEIDLLEARGNNESYRVEGSDQSGTTSAWTRDEGWTVTYANGTVSKQEGDGWTVTTGGSESEEDEND